MKYIIISHYEGNNDYCFISTVANGMTEVSDILENHHQYGFISKAIKKTDFFRDCKNNEDKISRLLRETGISVEEWWIEDKKLSIHINWGDWKHDHAHLDNIVTKIFGDVSKLSEEVTEEDGSDCYSSVHNYLVYRW